MKPAIGIRWTIGDVSARGFDALRLSIWGAWHIFGPDAAYAVCVNSVALDQARARTGPVPDPVVWVDATGLLPHFIAKAFGTGMAEGVAWKFAPLRLFADRHEISLDNDCILWAMPSSMAAWLQGQGGAKACLMAEDVKASFGRLAPLCPPRALNSGIRGLPPAFDLAASLRQTIELCSRQDEDLVLDSELDEQGLQAAALSLAAPLSVVTLDEVTVCSPFHPHLPHMGRCGAHFVGLNARHISWDYYERPADAWMTEHWQHHMPQLGQRTNTPQDAALSGFDLKARQ